MKKIKSFIILIVLPGRKMSIKHMLNRDKNFEVNLAWKITIIYTYTMLLTFGDRYIVICQTRPEAMSGSSSAIT